MLFEVRRGDTPMNIETDRTEIIIDYDENGRLAITVSEPDSSGRTGVVYEVEAEHE
jgi:hypothetical protein